MDRPPSRRRRPALSCIECRRRKIKCDRNYPCLQCVAANGSCTYKPNSSKRDVHPTAAHEIPVLTPATSTLGVPVSADAGTISTPRASTWATDSQTNLGLSVALEQPDAAQYLRHCTGEAAQHTSRGADADNAARAANLQQSHIELKKTRTLRWTDLLSEAPQFAAVGACLAKACEDNSEATSATDLEHGALLSRIGDLYGQCKHLAKKIKAFRPSRCLTRLDFELTPPSRDFADTLVNLYFHSFESTFRILHRTTFQAQYEEYWNNPDAITFAARLMIHLVIGLGLSISDNSGSPLILRDTVRHWIHTAQTWLSGPLEKDRLTVAGLQVHCLVIVARQVFSVGGDLVWVSTGSLVNQAMQMGFHRDPEYLPKTNILQAELRRRLWATILELVVQSSLDATMPSRISLDDYDARAPSNFDDDELNDVVVSLTPQSREVFTDTSLQILLRDSLPLRLRIVHLLNTLHTGIAYASVLELSSELTDTLQSCNKYMATYKGATTSFHCNLLDYSVRRFLLALHCPFAVLAHSNPLYYYSSKVSVDTALAMIPREEDTDFYGLMTISAGMFKEGLRYTMAIITLTLVADTSVQRADGTLQRLFRQSDILKLAIKSLIRLSVERLRQEETNVKGYMFLEMIMAQIDAMQVGIRPSELPIARAAKKTLEICLELLQVRSDAATLNDLERTPGFPDDALHDFDIDMDFFLSNQGFA